MAINIAIIIATTLCTFQRCNKLTKGFNNTASKIENDIGTSMPFKLNKA